MKLKDFLDMYTNKRGITKINDDNLGRLATGTAAQIIYGFADWRKVDIHIADCGIRKLYLLSTMIMNYTFK